MQPEPELQDDAKNTENIVEKYEREFWALVFRKLQKSKISDIVLAATSIALTIIGVSQLVIAWENYRDTSPLVGYAKDQAQAAKDFATAAGGINSGVGSAVGKLNDQAVKLGENVGQASRLAAASESANSNVIGADRPWLAIVLQVPTFEKGVKAEAFVNITNTGRRPAKLIAVNSASKAYQAFPEKPEYTAGNTSKAILVPGQLANTHFDISTYTADAVYGMIQGPDWAYYVYSYVTYEDIRDHSIHHTWACIVYRIAVTRGAAAGFYGCDTYNDAD